MNENLPQDVAIRARALDAAVNLVAMPGRNSRVDTVLRAAVQFEAYLVGTKQLTTEPEQTDQ